VRVRLRRLRLCLRLRRRGKVMVKPAYFKARA
jgi:hypothetical protein